MTQETHFAELQTLKEQFALLSRKLDKQAIINDSILNEAMTRHVSVIEREYRSRFQIALIGAPVLTVVFLLITGFHWGFILLMDAVAATEFLLDRRCYRALAPQRLMTLNMTDAAERAIRYRKLRSLTHRILLIPNIVLNTCLSGEEGQPEPGQPAEAHPGTARVNQHPDSTNEGR